VFLFDPDTGRVKAMVGGNFLTALRTAAASSVSIRHLARKDAKVLGMIGAGHQAKFQLRAAAETHRLREGHRLEPAPRDAAGPRRSGRRGRPALRGGGASRHGEADVIITITSSFAPTLLAEHVSPGTHLACMGTDTKGKQEVEAALLGRATVFCDEVAQSVSIGEAQHAMAEG
jgi:alanine dehydrogenase